jgi:hypothetical protein
VPSKRLLFELKSKSATFRVADTDPPLEEISVVGKGRFKGKVLTSLSTTRIRPTGESRDIEEGRGILYLEGNGRATYTIEGSIGSTHKWRELARGTMTFAEKCTGTLKELRKSRASYLTVVNLKGESHTKVWKEDKRQLRSRRLPRQ